MKFYELVEMDSYSNCPDVWQKYLLIAGINAFPGMNTILKENGQKFDKTSEYLVPAPKEVYLQDGNYNYEFMGPILFCKDSTGLAGTFTDRNGISYIPACDLMDTVEMIFSNLNLDLPE